MEDTKDQVQLDDSILFKTIASGCSSEIHKLLRLCDHKTSHFSNNALDWAVFEACHLRHDHLLQFLLKDGTRLELRDNNGNTPLMICSAKGFPDIINKLLRLGADVNAKNIHGDTALMLAKSREAIQSLLKDRRLDLDEQNLYGYTALMSAILTSHLQKVKLLINAGANPNRRVRELAQSGSILWVGSLGNNLDENAFDLAKRMGFGKLLDLLYRAKMFNLNPLQLAAVNNDFETCVLLLKYKLCPRNETQNLRPDILCYVIKQIQQRDAILSSDIEFVRELCTLGMNVNRCQCCTKSRMEVALNIGSYELAEILCDHGVKLTHDDLVSAVKGQHIEMIPLLVNHGAPVNDIDHMDCATYKGSAMDIALERSLTSTASFLFDHGAALDPLSAVSKALRTNNSKTLNFLLKECAEVKKPETLIRAVKLGDIQLIQLLLDAGADIDGVHNNNTPLMSAVHTEIVDFLLNKGANVNFKTNTTPLINALYRNYYPGICSAYDKRLNPKEMEEQLLLALEILLKHGANLEDADENGCTALTASVKNCLGVAVLKFLLEKGADVNRKNKNGLTALHVAVMTHQYNCVETLLKYGADVNLNFYLTADLGQDGQEQKSALSIVLNSWFPSEEAQRTALMMIDHGASSELVRRDIIHRLIAADNDGILVQKLMKSGISPIDVALQSNVFSWPETSVSPLAVSLILDSLDISRYLIENWFLTKSDIKILSRNKKIIDYLELHTSKPVSYLKEFSRQPMRLELLCFITVSSALGSDQGRRQRVHNSKLPAVVQNQLLFSKLEHKVLEQVSDDNLLLYSEMFLKKQLL